eukprot:COSAG01_NODE_21505_length_899_cov_0.911250_2_plen_90_part_00
METQVWDVGKRLERAAKVHLLCKDGNGASAIHPIRYQERFMDNLDLITADENELQQLLNSSVGMVVAKKPGQELPMAQWSVDTDAAAST